jgi:hypothetical protein
VDDPKVSEYDLLQLRAFLVYGSTQEDDDRFNHFGQSESSSYRPFYLFSQVGHTPRYAGCF